MNTLNTTTGALVLFDVRNTFNEKVNVFNLSSCLVNLARSGTPLTGHTRLAYLCRRFPQILEAVDPFGRKPAAGKKPVLGWARHKKIVRYLKKVAGLTEHELSLLEKAEYYEDRREIAPYHRYEISNYTEFDLAAWVKKEWHPMSALGYSDIHEMGRQKALAEGYDVIKNFAWVELSPKAMARAVKTHTMTIDQTMATFPKTCPLTSDEKRGVLSIYERLDKHFKSVTPKSDEMPSVLWPRIGTFAHPRLWVNNDDLEETLKLLM
jgi:hypothetical protein